MRSTKPTFTKSAFDRLVGYLSRRDHSVRELSQKLARYHDFDEVEAAILKADRLKLLPDPKDFAQRLSKHLLSRGKGKRYISAYLKKKGLPVIAVSEAAELEKALKLVVDQLRFEPPFTLSQKQKIFRYLNNRGFDSKVVKQVMYEK